MSDKMLKVLSFNANQKLTSLLDEYGSIFILQDIILLQEINIEDFIYGLQNSKYRITKLKDIKNIQDVGDRVLLKRRSDMDLGFIKNNIKPKSKTLNKLNRDIIIKSNISKTVNKLNLSSILETSTSREVRSILRPIKKNICQKKSEDDYNRLEDFGAIYKIQFLNVELFITVYRWVSRHEAGSTRTGRIPSNKATCTITKTPPKKAYIINPFVYVNENIYKQERSFLYVETEDIKIYNLHNAHHEKGLNILTNFINKEPLDKNFLFFGDINFNLKNTQK